MGNVCVGSAGLSQGKDIMGVSGESSWPVGHLAHSVNRWPDVAGPGSRHPEESYLE